jgi:hypothetical protein
VPVVHFCRAARITAIMLRRKYLLTVQYIVLVPNHISSSTCGTYVRDAACQRQRHFSDSASTKLLKCTIGKPAAVAVFDWFRGGVDVALKPGTRAECAGAFSTKSNVNFSPSAAFHNEPRGNLQMADDKMGEGYGNPGGGMWSSGSGAVKGGEAARPGQSLHDEAASTVNPTTQTDTDRCRCGHLRGDHAVLPTAPDTLVCDIPGCWCGGFQLPDAED